MEGEHSKLEEENIMTTVAKSLTDLIGNTPLLELSNYNEKNNLENKIIAKLEYFNPGGSVKDRIGFAMIKDAQDKGLLNKDTVIIEPTSGNTGIALAYIAAAKGLKIILTMPETMSIERRTLLSALGAEIVLTPGALGMRGAIQKAEELSKSIENSFLPQQFKNEANPKMHKNTTAVEIWKDTDGLVDIVVAGVGTGGTITGVGEGLKLRNPNIRIVAVEPKESAVLNGGKPAPHKIQGIGAGFIPDIYNKKVIDEVFDVTSEQAVKASREIAKEEGLIIGISSGAALYAATEIAKRKENKGKTIVAILPDTGERYLSTDLYQKQILGSDR